MPSLNAIWSLASSVPASLRTLPTSATARLVTWDPLANKSVNLVKETLARAEVLALRKEMGFSVDVTLGGKVSILNNVNE